MTLLDHMQESAPKNEVSLTRSGGGTPAIWIKRPSPSRGGDSKRTLQRKTARLKTHLNAETSGMSAENRDKAISKACSDSVSTPLFKYVRHNRMLIDDSAGSVTIKIHQLVDHTAKQLTEYGTIGLLAEDSVESIHAIVNVLARWYATLDSNRRSTQVMRALTMRKMTSTKKLAKKVRERQQRGQEEEESTRKKGGWGHS